MRTTTRTFGTLVFLASVLAACGDATAPHPGDIAADPEDPSALDASHDGDCDATVSGGASIQSAIDGADSGNTICVEAGTFVESLAIDRDIVLRGAQAGVDARGRDASESILTAPGENAIFISRGADVTVDGFRFDDVLRFVLTEDVGAGSPGIPSGWGDLELRNNIFRNAGAPEGGSFWLRDDPGTRFVFERNHLTGSGLSNGLRIQAIPRSEPGAGPVQVEISDNLWEDNAGWAMAVHRIRGVISGNRVRNVEGDQWGFLLATEDTDLRLERNDFEGLTAFALALAFGFSGELVATGNSFTGNAGAVVVGAGEEVGDVSFRFNDFEGNGVGVSHGGSGVLDARCNWWGAADGPGGQGPGGGDGVSENVDFDPWLATAFADADRCPPELDHGTDITVDGNFECDGAFVARVDGNVTVPAYAECALIDSFVDGNIRVRRGAAFRLTDSEVDGNIEADGAERVEVGDSTIDGNIQVEKSGRVVVTGNTVDGDVELEDNAEVEVSGNAIDGDLECEGNAAIEGGGNRVEGDKEGQCAGF